MINVTYKRVLDFWDQAELYLQKNKDNENKLTYAITKMIGSSKERRKGRLFDALAKLEEDKQDLKIDFCSVDDKGNILKDKDGSFVFTKDNLKKLSKATRDLDKKEIAIEPYIATEYDESTLTETEVDAFKSFVIN